MADEPIQKCSHGHNNVVDIGEVRVERGLTQRPFKMCRHRSLVYSDEERRIWCADCERTVDGYEAFKIVADQFKDAAIEAERHFEAAHAAEQASIHLIAARNLEKAWRSKSMLPCCPSCREPMFPEDFKREQFSMVSKELAYQARMRKGVE